MDFSIYKPVKFGHRAQDSVAECIKTRAQFDEIGGRMCIFGGRFLSKEKGIMWLKNRWSNA